MKWIKNRRNSGLVEWICIHGCGHPDYEVAMALGIKNNQGSAYLIHGCDGCCNHDSFPGKKKIKEDKQPQLKKKNGKKNKSS